MELPDVHRTPISSQRPTGNHTQMRNNPAYAAMNKTVGAETGFPAPISNRSQSIQPGRPMQSARNRPFVPDSFEVVGNKFGMTLSPGDRSAVQWHQKERGRRNSPKAGQFDHLTVKDIVSATLGEKEWGHSFYQSPSNEMLLKKIPLCVSDRSKQKSFIDVVQKKGSWVPGPVYNREIDWNNTLPKNAGKFKKSPRYVLADEIINSHKHKEKSVPGPNHYREDQAWRKKSRVERATGNYNYKDKRASFIDEPSNQKFINPSPDKYEKVQFDKYLNRSLQTKIHKSHFPRFEPIKQDLKPSPASYNTSDAISKHVWQSTRYSIGKDQRKETFETRAKLSISPGPGAHKLVEAAYDKICTSPMLRSKRH